MCASTPCFCATGDGTCTLAITLPTGSHSPAQVFIPLIVSFDELKIETLPFSFDARGLKSCPRDHGQPSVMELSPPHASFVVLGITLRSLICSEVSFVLAVT